MASQNPRQGRNKQGQFTSVKARKVNPVSGAPTKPIETRTTDSPAKKPHRTTHQAPTGHMGEGVGSVEEYVERARIVYRAFLRLIRDRA